MASYIRLTEQDDAGVPTPPTGKVNIFVDDVTGEPSYKDDTGTVATLVGAEGPQGDAGPAGQGVPVGGTAGQVLAKIDGTDYNTEWVDQSGGGAGTWGSITGTLTDQTDLQTALDAKLAATISSPAQYQVVEYNGSAFINGRKITSSSTEPTSPATGDIWLDTSGA